MVFPKRVLCYICEIAACPSIDSILLFSHLCALVLTSITWLVCKILVVTFLFFFPSPLHVFVGAFLLFLVQGLSVTKLSPIIGHDSIIYNLYLIIQHISLNAGFCTINGLASSIIQ